MCGGGGHLHYRWPKSSYEALILHGKMKETTNKYIEVQVNFRCRGSAEMGHRSIIGQAK